ncbi:MAG: hypothetical protein JWL64_2515 [Frankiales bacterium]|nr:hypothetical protein [Frankiales bacterium]
MTPLEEKEARVLEICAAEPLADGDVLLMLNGERNLEIAGLADNWDAVARDGIDRILAQLPLQRVVVAIARPGADLTAADRALGRDITDLLAPRGVAVTPVQALPSR